MGNFLSTNSNGVEEVTSQASGAYKYPPSGGGSFFANHFIMGGEKFDSPQPEAFLFGENADLNFLGGKPVPFPYPPPQKTNEPTKTLRSLINIRRDSLHFVAVPVVANVNLAAPEDDHIDPTEHQTENEENRAPAPEDLKKLRKYNIEFTFDSDVRCAITIYYFCAEELGQSSVTYNPKDPAYKSDTYYFKRGASQVFKQPAHIFQPGIYPESWLTFSDDLGTIPVAIQCVATEGDLPRQCHTTFGIIERSADGGFLLKAFKQKLFVDGLSYLLQEIYGLENKSVDVHPNLFDDEDGDDDCGADCVVCMCDLRDTIILPCRHLCLCFACAESLRYQANNCPICRAPFIALLQIRAVQRINHATHPALAGTEPGGQDGIPQGYQAISLLEALNGPPNSSAVSNLPVLSLNSSEPRPTGTVSASGKRNKSKRRNSQESRNRYCRSHSVTSPGPTHGQNEDEFREDEPLSGAPLSQRNSNPAKAPNVVELKIVNEVGSQCSPHLELRSNRSATPPSLDIVDEELAKLSVETTSSSKKSAHKDEGQTEKLLPPKASIDFDDDEAGIEVDDLESSPGASASVRIVGTSAPGTPISGTSVRSSQESASSATSTKQLLPQSALAAVSSDRKISPVTVTFTPTATFVQVVPTKTGDDEDDVC